MHADDILNAAKQANPDFIVGPHHKVVAEALAAVTPTSRSRLLIALPPRFSKTSLALAFTDAFTAAYPEHNVFLAEATDDLAAGLARSHPNDRRKVVGMHSHVPSIPAGLVFVDDPLSAYDYQLPIQQRDIQIAMAVSHITINLRHRLAAGGSLVVCMSRFADDDVFARLQKTDEWGHIAIPAMMDESSSWPAFWSNDELNNTRAAVGSRVWAASYQQEPLPA